MIDFQEENSAFYDLEYYISLEYRYASGAHASKVRNVLEMIGSVSGKQVLDIGCGGGFFTHILNEQGAQATGIDYSPHAIAFAKERFPKEVFRMVSAYHISGTFPAQSFDVITMLDVIEHMSNQGGVLQEIRRVLKPNGLLVISTDAEESPWIKKKWFGRMCRFLERYSAEGRAYRMIKKVENYRRKSKNYHVSHIGSLSVSRLSDLLDAQGFVVQKRKMYPLVGVPIRDAFLSVLPERYRGDCQCLLAQIRSQE